LLTMRGEFTIGMVMAFQGFLSAFSAPASSLIESGQRLQEMRSEMERVEDVMEYPTDPLFEETGKKAADNRQKLRGDISLKGVSFGYSHLEKPLIQDFDLTVKSGGSVGIVGPSGCGKSTAAKLISGLYQPWSGEILFDGKHVSQIDRGVFTGSVAVIDQDITLFKDTIAGNIRLWDDSIEDFEVILAARDAQLHEDIMQREGGYQYRIREGGNDFSGGQRQCMEIARMLAQDPTIIIMDEATSALDARTELDVIEAIRARGITCIMVAHRLSTIRDCDEILVMDKGRVVERGKHDQLVAAGGLYAQLISNE
ncbi:MAG TPA: ATP-binding cassette domain-containing protein, partial [Candidatus Pullichristensenella excrementigallinarum]|nr:ATP-binding cassette domain-containing protein [Candidatus Pullichristensenella excrementigallinarum]